MFNFIDIDNIQKYFNDADLEHITPVSSEGTFVDVNGSFFNLENHRPGVYNIRLLSDDTYAVCLNNKQRYDLKYDESNRCTVEQRC